MAQRSPDLLYVARVGSSDMPSKFCTWSFILMHSNNSGTFYQVTSTPVDSTPSKSASPVPKAAKSYAVSKSDRVDFLTYSDTYSKKFLGAVYLCPVANSENEFWKFYDALTKAVPSTVDVDVKKEWKLSHKWVVSAISKLAEKGFEVECLTKDQIEKKLEEEKMSRKKIH